MLISMLNGRYDETQRKQNKMKMFEILSFIEFRSPVILIVCF